MPPARTEFDRELDDAERQLHDLRTRYEQYFLGLERLEPKKEREQIRQKLLKLKTSPQKNTGARFRAESLHQRYLTYERLWLRTSREIEDGTYHRLRAKKQQLAAVLGTPEEKDTTSAGDAAVAAKTGSDAKADGAGAGSEGAATATRAANGAPTTPERNRAARPAQRGAIDDERLRALFDQYVEARRQSGQSVAGVKFESVAETLRKQAADLVAKHRCKGVDFNVMVKEGKAVFKARLKR